MNHDDFDFEPVRGLPALLPEGERLLWQGSPDWRSLAARAYHVRMVAGYFLLLVLWRIGVGFHEGHTLSAVAVSCLFLLTLGGIAAGVLALLAYLNARSTVYSITSRRVLLRHGVAVPLTMNIPFKLIDNAALKTFANGTGDIALTLPRNERVGYLITWPHLRPSRITRPEPSFRALREPDKAADILSAALAAEAGAMATGKLRPQTMGSRYPAPRSGTGARPAPASRTAVTPRAVEPVATTDPRSTATA